MTHTIETSAETLGTREVHRPTCQCGWQSERTYLTPRFARMGGDREHIADVLAQRT